MLHGRAVTQQNLPRSITHSATFRDLRSLAGMVVREAMSETECLPTVRAFDPHHLLLLTSLCGTPILEHLSFANGGLGRTVSVNVLPHSDIGNLAFLHGYRFRTQRTYGHLVILPTA